MEQTDLTLENVVANGYIKKDHHKFCTVYLKGKDVENPKVKGIVYTGRTDYAILEHAYRTHMER